MPARKFSASTDDLAEARGIVTGAVRTITPTVQLDVIKEDPDDNRILECAVTAGSHYIITGDNDLLRLRQYDAIGIVTAGDFIEMLQQAENEL
jgi:putative PIN family toxin of toxin-antitoxin system